MINRAAFSVSILLSLSACSGAIHKESSLKGVDPIAITVDARQRLILSQFVLRPATDSEAAGKLRRFCAEPSPDAFTVLGVAASGSGNLGLDSTSKTASGALQAAFSSNETGATFARTQTINMLREMMFRTCERYLSGAIDEAQFQTIAARDQRIMVSILAIEQLTGAITPPAIAIGSSGNGSTGFDPAELAKSLAKQRETMVTAKTTLEAKQRALGTADTPAGTCKTLGDKAAAGTAWATGEEDKYKACTAAQKDVDTAKSESEIADALYAGMLKDAGKGQGVSTVGTSSIINLGEQAARKEQVAQVATAVKEIVAETFNQDETLLFCLQVLSPTSRGDRLQDVAPMCLHYLQIKVITDTNEIARGYGLTPQEYRGLLDLGQTRLSRRLRVAAPLSQCFSVAGNAQAIAAALATTTFAPQAEGFTAEVKKSARDAERALARLGDDAEDEVLRKFDTLCNLGGV